MNESKPALDSNILRPDPSPSVEVLLERYRLRVHRMHRAQYLAAKHCQHMNSVLGTPTAILSAVVGTSIFASASSTSNTVLLPVVGSVSLLSAVLATMQTFFHYSERSEKHRAAGASYAALKSELDVLSLRMRTGMTVDDALRVLSDVLSRINQLRMESLDVPDRLYDRARREQEADSEGV